MNVRGLSKKSTRWIIGSIATGIAFTGVIILYSVSILKPATEKTSSSSVTTTPTVTKVTALGRLEPEGEIVEIAAPLDLDGDRVAELLVKEGDRVATGQIIAILDSRDPLQDQVAHAKQQVKLAQAQLAQVKAGAQTGKIMAQQAVVARIEAEKTTEIEAQEAIIARLEAQLQNAETENRRHKTLYEEGAISASLGDSKYLTFQIAQQQLAEAKATLNRIKTAREQELKQARATLAEIAEVRPVDIEVAQAEVERAIAALKQAQTNLEQAYVRTPIAGRILDIQTRPGARIRDSGIVTIAQTDQIIAVAEVYQSDIRKVRLGQQAIITSEVFPGKLQGIVSRIDLQVSRQNIFSNQPGENLDRRVIEVEIRLTPEASKRVEGLSNLQVQIAIEP